MNLADIATMAATMSANASEMVLVELFFQSDWRCYSTELSADTPELAQRYLDAHARIPGLLTTEMLGEIPLEVIRWTKRDNDVQLVCEGVTFLNGAVVLMHLGAETITLLFVSNEVAVANHYPEEGFRPTEGTV